MATGGRCRTETALVSLPSIIWFAKTQQRSTKRSCGTLEVCLGRRQRAYWRILPIRKAPFSFGAPWRTTGWMSSHWSSMTHTDITMSRQTESMFGSKVGGNLNPWGPWSSPTWRTSRTEWPRNSPVYATFQIHWRTPTFRTSSPDGDLHVSRISIYDLNIFSFSLKGANNEKVLKREIEDYQCFGFNIGCNLGASIRTGCGLCPDSRSADDPDTYDTVYYQEGDVSIYSAWPIFQAEHMVLNWKTHLLQGVKTPKVNIERGGSMQY